MVRVHFDVAHLYYLTQYLPVRRALERAGAECCFTVYGREGEHDALLRDALARLALPRVTWVRTQEEAAERYRAEAPEWVVFGHGFGPLGRLAPATQSAQLHHGIGMKADVYDADNFRMDVRFTEGPHYTEVLGERFPGAQLVEVGYPKVDPLFWPPEERERVLDPAALGLDPEHATVLYAPTSFPSSFGAMPMGFPQDFQGLNVIVKAHPFSYTKPRYRDHRRRMRRWAKAPNVHVVGPEAWDPVPYLAAADLLVSDASSMLFEFAAQDRPVVWCDFRKLRLSYRGPFRHRLERRLDREVERYADVAAHAARYGDLRQVVDHELAYPEQRSAERRAITARLVGPTDGRSGERVARYLLEHAGEERRDRRRPAGSGAGAAARVRTAVILAAGRGTRLGDAGRERPKGFLEVGGRAIVEQSLDKLEAVGVERVVIVTGHCPEAYRELARRRPVVELVHNERYADAGSLRSLCCARAVVDGDCLVLESDLVYERRALEHLLAHPARDVVLLSGLTASRDEVFVEAPDGRLVAMSKERAALGAVTGEFTGLNKLSAPLLEALERWAAAAERERGPLLDYETDGLVAVAREHAIACPVLEDLAWGEIDDAALLARAERLWPTIEERDRRGVAGATGRVR